MSEQPERPATREAESATPEAESATPDAVAAARRRLSELGELPVEEHAAVYADVHRQLQDALADAQRDRGEADRHGQAGRGGEASRGGGAAER